MAIEKTAIELIKLCYDAALAPAKWSAFMAPLAAAMGAHCASLRESDADGRHVGVFETVGYDPADVQAYRDHFVRLDHFRPALAEVPIGNFLSGDEAVPWALQRRSEFHTDYVQRRLKSRHVMGGILARSDRHAVQLALLRESGLGDFDADGRELIRLVAPHMVLTMQIHRRLTKVTSEKHWALSALDRLRVGVILLDERGLPLHLNHEAQHLVRGDSQFGLSAGHDGLALAATSETLRLRLLIAGAAAFAAGKKATAGGGLRVHALSGAATMQLQVIPLPRDLSERPWAQPGAAGCVAVFVTISGGPHLSWRRMAAAHGFTRAEARLASRLAEGASLEEAAAALSVSIATVRSHLKSVFAKTGVTRQGALVALLLADMLNDHAHRRPPSAQ